MSSVSAMKQNAPGPLSASNSNTSSCFGFRYTGAVTSETLIWFLASFFPGTALLYSVFNIVARLYEIEDSAQFLGTYRLYAPPGTPGPDALKQFQNYARARFREYYNPWELVEFAVSAGALVVLLGKLVIAKNYAPYLGEPLDWAKLPIAFTAGAGLAGGVAGALVLILKRYRTFNIYPSTYLHILALITAAAFAGTLWHFVLTENLAIFLAFAIAFLAALNLEYFVGLMTNLVARATGQTPPERPPSDLATVIQNADAIEVLNNISVFTIQEFISMDPMRLYLNLPQAIGTIQGWIDTAILRYFFTNQLDALSVAGVRQFSSLFNRVAIIEANPPTLTWRTPAEINTIGNVNVAQVLQTVRDVVENDNYERQLGVASNNYLKLRRPIA